MLCRKMPTYIQSLQPHQLHESIIVQTCREWTNKNYRTSHVLSHDYVLVDKEVKMLVQFIVSNILFKPLYYIKIKRYQI